MIDSLTLEDGARVAAVARALARIRALDAEPLSLGLSADNARLCLDLALDQISAEGLAQELSTPGERPEDVTIVAAHGVFTATLEWLLLYAAAGIRVTLKSSSRGPEAGAAFVEAFAAEGLPVLHTTGRELGEPEVIVAFGGDDSLDALRLEHPGSHLVGFGDRSSLALVTGEPTAAVVQALASDVVLYDTRGCMAPAAVLTTGDPEALAEALFRELERWRSVVPMGWVDPLHGPERRRRLGLARVLGRTWESEESAVCVLPQAHLPRQALPRCVSVIGIEDVDAMVSELEGAAAGNSSLAVDDPSLPVRDPRWLGAFRAFPRVCAVGSLQTPAFPRRHDGLPMLGCVLRG